jgi:hypothetical protein
MLRGTYVQYLFITATAIWNDASISSFSMDYGEAVYRLESSSLSLTPALKLICSLKYGNLSLAVSP